MEMLKIRNQLTHDYDGDVVKQHCKKIIYEYIDKFYEYLTAVGRLQGLFDR